MKDPQVTLVIPSLNQGVFLEETLKSIFSQDLDVEVYVLDGGSTDNTLDILRNWESSLSGWRSHKDNGQASAINEGIEKGKSPYVGWMNADDIYLQNGLVKLYETIENVKDVPAVYGKAWNIDVHGKKIRPYWTVPFNIHHFANRCFVSQPATLIRRSAWEDVGGLNTEMNMAFDYDLWWKLYKKFGPLQYLHEFVAGNRRHDNTKTTINRKQHYEEAMHLVHKYYGRVPLKWYLAKPVMVYLWLFIQKLKKY